MAPDLINQLRDIHYPPPISIWPLALGWDLVIAIGLFIIAITIYLWIKNIKKHLLKKIVLQRLNELQNQQASNIDIADEISMLLKRAALASHPRREVAGLYGEKWLHFLDKTAETTEFSSGPGRLLIVCPYQGKRQPLPAALFHLIQNWVRKNL